MGTYHARFLYREYPHAKLYSENIHSFYSLFMIISLSRYTSGMSHMESSNTACVRSYRMERDELL